MLFVCQTVAENAEKNIHTQKRSVEHTYLHFAGFSKCRKAATKWTTIFIRNVLPDTGISWSYWTTLNLFSKNEWEKNPKKKTINKRYSVQKASRTKCNSGFDVHIKAVELVCVLLTAVWWKILVKGEIGSQ